MSRSPLYPDRLPPAAAGQRIGILGGSFDPAHAGHRAISLTALRRLRLDAVWWLVSPANPLKSGPAASLDRRLAEAAAVAGHPRIAVSGVERAFRTPYTVDALAIIARRLPGVRFVWLMGADNFAAFHRWKRWRELADRIPLAVIDRPGYGAAAEASPAARALRSFRLPERHAAALAFRPAPAWVHLHAPLVAASSTALRAATTPKGPS